MERTAPFGIGSDVGCADGICGTLTRVVIDPVSHTVSHLIVEPAGERHDDRLVPIDLVDASADGIRLRCTVADFETLDPVAEERFIEGTTVDPAYGPKQAIFWPYYGLRGKRGDVVADDAIPPGEMEVRRGEHVHATDGTIGRVEGLAIEPDGHRMTHVLLQEGHLWGRKQVAIPVAAVTRIDDGVRLNLTKQQVQDLPPVDIDHLA